MLKIEKKLPSGAAVAPVLRRRARKLVLAFAERGKSRLRTQLADGTEAGLFLARGTVLRGGDMLVDEHGGLVEVEAAPEAVYEVRPRADAGDAAFDLLRAAYHLGNRHVPVQLAPGLLRIERDVVLRDLLHGLGMAVEEAVASFEPEAGAYGGGHRHDHDAHGGSVGEQLSIEAHGHQHDHKHDHEHAHAHGDAHHDHTKCGHDHAHGHAHGPAHAAPLRFAPLPRKRSGA